MNENESKLFKGNIVTLENGDEYLLCERITYNGKYYFYSGRIDESENVKSYKVLEKIVSDGEEYVRVVTDIDIQQIVLGKFRHKMKNRKKNFAKIFVVEVIGIVIMLIIGYFLSSPWKSISIILLTFLIFNLIHGIRLYKVLNIKFYEKTAEDSSSW